MHIQIEEPTEFLDEKEIHIDLPTGIDFGTTHCVVSYITPQKNVEFVPFEKSSTLYPSVIDISHSKEILTGPDALKNSSPDVLYSIKRFIGSSQTQFIHFDNKEISLVELSSFIFKDLKKWYENFLKIPLKKAVITVPAYFDDVARKCIKEAAQLAGITVLRLIAEPTAAALSYKVKEEGLYLVYDLGGGTFDVSLLNLKQGIFQVLATGGDIALGGDDFDKALATFILTKQNIDINKISESEFQKTIQFAKLLKEKLSNHNEVKVEIALLGEITISQSDLKDCILSFIEKSLKITKKVLRDASVESSEIKNIILVGGSTRIPFIKTILAETFSISTLCSQNPDTVVAQGAAIQAHMIESGDIEDLLIDVTPLSLGIELLNDSVDIIIPRNSPLPAQASAEFTNSEDGQTGIIIHIVQGEHKFASECRTLGTIHIPIHPLKANFSRVEVTFNLDVNGLLTVTALDKETLQKYMYEVNPVAGLNSQTLKSLIEI